MCAVVQNFLWICCWQIIWQTVWYCCGSELNSTVILWTARFICHLSKFNICSLSRKEQQWRKGSEEKRKSIADYSLCFWKCPSFTLLALFKKKNDQRTGIALSFESCLASAMWWLAFVLLEQRSVLRTVWTLIIAHLSNLLLWKELGWRSTCKVAAAEAKRCALLFGDLVVSSPSLMLLIHPPWLSKCRMLYPSFALWSAHKKC